MAQHPTSADRARLDRAAARLRRGDAAGALAEHLAAVRDAPDDAEPLLAMAETAVRVGRPSLAVAPLTAFTAIHPRHVGALDALGVSLTHTYRGEEAAEAFRRALDEDSRHARTWADLGWLRLRESRLAEAAEALATAVELDPSLAVAHQRRCWVLRRLGSLAAAIASGREALCLDDGQDAYNHLAFALLAADRAEEAVELCRAGLRRHRHNVAGITHLGNALAAAGRRDEAAALMDFERLVTVMRVNRVGPYVQPGAFGEALVRTVLASPSRPADPIQTPNLMLAPDDAVRVLAAVVDQATKRYLEALPRDPAHPWLAERPTRWTLDLWGTRMEQMDRIEHHYHPNGWVSGVYYARVPRFVGDAATGTRGCIEFVRHQQYGQRAVTSEFMVVPPEPGLLVLFPSFLPHRVVEFPRSELRVSLAFNAMPPEWGFHQGEL